MCLLGTLCLFIALPWKEGDPSLLKFLPRAQGPHGVKPSGYLGHSVDSVYPTSSRIMFKAQNPSLLKGRIHMEATGHLLAPLPNRPFLELVG